MNIFRKKSWKIHHTITKYLFIYFKSLYVVFKLTFRGWLHRYLHYRTTGHRFSVPGGWTVEGSCSLPRLMFRRTCKQLRQLVATDCIHGIMDLQCCFLPISWLLLYPDCCSLFPCFGRRSKPDSDGWTCWTWWFEAVLSSSLFWQLEDQRWWLQHMAGRLEVDSLAFIQAPNTEWPFGISVKQLWTWQNEDLAHCCLFVFVEKKPSYLPYTLVLFHVLMPQFCLGYSVQIKTLFKVVTIKELFFFFLVNVIFLLKGVVRSLTPPRKRLTLLWITAAGCRLK